MLVKQKYVRLDGTLDWYWRFIPSDTKQPATAALKAA